MIEAMANEVEGNCKIVELKHKYENLNVLLERKNRNIAKQSLSYFASCTGFCERQTLHT